MGVIITPTFRVSYPNVFQKKLNKLSNKEEYSVVAIFSKNSDLSGLRKAAEQALIEKFGPDRGKWPKGKPMQNPFRKCEDKRDSETGELPGGMEEGGFFMNFKSQKNKPTVLDENKQEMLDESQFYAGCYAIASVNAYAYKHESGTWGVSFGLHHLMKKKDGEPLGSTTRAENDFAQIEAAGTAGVAVNGKGEVASASDLF